MITETYENGETFICPCSYCNETIPFTPQELTDMALALGDPIDLGNATPEELDQLVLAYFGEID